MNSDYWDELRAVAYFIGTITGGLAAYWSQVGRMELAGLAGVVSGACFVLARRIKPSVLRMVDSEGGIVFEVDTRVKHPNLQEMNKSPIKSDETPAEIAPRAGPRNVP